MLDDVLGRSTALDELESKSLAERAKKSALTTHSRNDDTNRLANTIRSYRTSVQRAVEDKSFSDEVERHYQSIKLQKIRTYRNEIAKGSWFRRWAKKAEDEIRVLQTVESELEEESRRERAKIIRESERAAGCLAPNGLNLRGKSLKGPFLGYGPLPCSIAIGKATESRHMEINSWEKSGRKYDSTTSGLTSVDPSMKMGTSIIRRAASNVTLYKLDLKTIFDSVSSPDGGLLNLRGLVAIFSKLGIHLGSDELAPLARCFDFSDDGKLSYDKFVWGFFDRRSLVRQWSRSFSKLSKDEALVKFQLADSLGDGRLTLKGLDRMLNVLGVKLSEEMLLSLYQQFKTKDARYIDVKAFLTFLETEQQGLGDAPAQFVAIYQESQLTRLLRDRSTLQRKASLLQSNLPSQAVPL